MPTALGDAVIGVASLAAAGFKIAVSDVTECEARHAFRRVDGAIARLGDSGAVELLPRSMAKPPYGWALALPGAGAYASHGGGLMVDPFTDQPIQLQSVPRCDETAWALLVKEAKLHLAKRGASRAAQAIRATHSNTPAFRRLDERTRAFLDGRATEGDRNNSAFAASANLLGCGMDQSEAERLIQAGAAACGLPVREARAAFASAVKAVDRKGRV